MSAAQDIRLKGFTASVAKRGIYVLIESESYSHSLPCLVQPVNEKTRQQLQILDDAVSHIVHIGRDFFEASNVDPKSITEIQRTDTLTIRSYRVQHFQDDAQRPAILFFCILS